MLTNEAQADAEHTKKLGHSLGGIHTPRMIEDNLAILLCSYFADWSDQEPDGETGWPPDAIERCDEVLAAIRAHYEQPKT